jgi:hypothetical protein
MDIVLGMAIIGLLISVLSAIYAGRGVRISREALRSAEKARIHQVLVDVLFEYRSAEMLIAIRTLWSFYNENKENLGEAYNIVRHREESEISKLEPELKLQREKTTLHHQRRLVGKYYSLLAGLYELGVIPCETLYTYWNKKDLEIIPKIIIPMEKALAKDIKTISEGEEHSALTRMQRLYNDCPDKKAIEP